MRMLYFKPVFNIHKIYMFKLNFSLKVYKAFTELLKNNITHANEK